MTGLGDFVGLMLIVVAFLVTAGVIWFGIRGFPGENLQEHGDAAPHTDAPKADG